MYCIYCNRDEEFGHYLYQHFWCREMAFSSCVEITIYDLP